MNELEDQGVLSGRSHIIERPRLTRLLDEATAPVMMLIAPAGYGKTTLARQWLTTREHIWYQGSSASSDVAALALGIAEAVEPIRPGAGRRLREWLPTSREPEDEVHVIVALLEDDLADWPADIWFVIDDYHLLASAASEDLVLKLFLEKSRRVFLTSRRQPAWSSAREVLYGNYFELGQSSLAMTVDEANGVLASTDNEAAEGLVAIANGWPAVIGLAAMTPAPVDIENEFPETLHDYLAEELFSSLPPSSQSALCRLALLPSIGRNVTQELLGQSSDHVLGDAASAGMLSSHGSRDQRFHPLLHVFLRKRLLDLPTSDVASAVTEATRTLIASGAWNDAFSLIERFTRADLLDELLSAALTSLTTQGRLATLRRWVEFGSDNMFESPYLDLVDGELAFRTGNFDRAEMLAKSAAMALPPQEPLRSAGYFRAGQSRDFMDDPLAALRHFQDARESALTVSDTQNALWGEFVVAIGLEQANAMELLEAFSALGAHDHDTTVRQASGGLILAIRDGGLSEAVSQATSATEIVDRAKDPLIRSVFLYSFATAHSFLADYEIALESVDRALEQTRAFDLEFAMPHMLICQATAHIGLREFRGADRTISRIEDWVKAKHDPFLLEKARALRCRLLLVEGSPRLALDGLAVDAPPPALPSLHAEISALRAAACAACGEPEAALEQIERAQKLSAWLWPQQLLAWTRVICASMLGDEVTDQARRTYLKTRDSGAFDVLVLAYRLHPPILETLARATDLRHEIAGILLRANDQRRAQALGLAMGRHQRRTSSTALTTREREVYELLAQGRSNREIGSALFISEPTAKKHVSHILQKLGVRTRTEAALKAARDDDFTPGLG